MSEEHTDYKAEVEELLIIPEGVEVVEFGETEPAYPEVESPEFVRTIGGPWIKFHTSFRNRLVARLKGCPLAVFVVIGLHVDAQNECYPTVETIARETGYSRRQVLKAIKILEGLDLIYVKRVHRHSSTYVVKTMFAYGDKNPFGEAPAPDNNML